MFSRIAVLFATLFFSTIASAQGVYCWQSNTCNGQQIGYYPQTQTVVQQTTVQPEGIGRSTQRQFMLSGADQLSRGLVVVALDRIFNPQPQQQVVHQQPQPQQVAYQQPVPAPVQQQDGNFNRPFQVQSQEWLGQFVNACKSAGGNPMAVAGSNQTQVFCAKQM